MPQALKRRLLRIKRWWWWVWTGHPSLESVRRQLENDVRRFGGRVTWED